MTQAHYLAIVISLLVLLGALALGLFLYLRHCGIKGGRKKCHGCDEAACPIAMKLREREEE